MNTLIIGRFRFLCQQTEIFCVCHDELQIKTHETAILQIVSYGRKTCYSELQRTKVRGV
jgi:hypothetical protein